MKNIARSIDFVVSNQWFDSLVLFFLGLEFLFFAMETSSPVRRAGTAYTVPDWIQTSGVALMR